MRLLIVSNRLPITAVQAEGELTLQESVGGLATGLSAYLASIRESSEYLWIGWPGSTVDEADQESLRSKMLSQFHACPVFLSEQEMERFYHGFCNSTIWALFHYFPSYVTYYEEYWRDYKRVNENFCKVICEIVKPGDVIWIHDYHLMLLPRMLREKIPEIPIGFFLHIPFPAFEVFRLLPSKWRSEILKGLLGADLIGFHTHDYVQYFLRCVLRILGYEHNMGEILVQDRLVRVDTFPMGIDFQKHQDGAQSDEAQKEKKELKQTLGDSKVILSIDRLDYSKGILNRLQGYEAFLQKSPGWQGKVVLVVVVVPSRVGVEHYQVMKRQIDETVGRINGRFARINWTPILYQYKSLSFYPLIALYSESDVILVTPLRDGMNLIAKEYVASRMDKTGVLILSEMAGASNELGEAIIINPNNVEEIADSLIEALEMPKEEQIRRNEIMQHRLKRYNVVRWANDFIQSLLSLQTVQNRFQSKLLSPQTAEALLRDYGQAQHRMILLDYDGTLVPFTARPDMAHPDEKLLTTLKRLSEHPGTDLVLISGRDKKTLGNWFSTIDIAMIAEHGVWIKERGRDWKLLKTLANDWKKQIIPIFEIYADRLPGAFVEEKEFSLVYHYREADPELASQRVKEFTDHLVHFTANLDVQVLKGSKVVEMRNAGINKGTAATYLLSKVAYDFILAIGDDWTDEDLFRILPKSAYSFKVGISASHAKYNLRSHTDVLQLIGDIAAI